MLKIRLKRIGRKGQPHYRVVVVESSKPRDGAIVSDLGHYSPLDKPSTFQINKEAAAEWLKKGAQPSDTVRQFFVKLDLAKAKRRGSVQSKGRKAKKASEAA